MWYQKLKDDAQVSTRILRIFQLVLVVFIGGAILLPDPYRWYAAGFGLLVAIAGTAFDFFVVAPLSRLRIRQLDDELARLAGDPLAADLLRARGRLGQSLQLQKLFIVIFCGMAFLVVSYPNRYTIGLAIVVTIVEAIVVIVRQNKKRQ